MVDLISLKEGICVAIVQGTEKEIHPKVATIATMVS